MKRKPSMVHLVHICECFGFGCAQFCYRNVISFDYFLFFVCHAATVVTDLFTVNLATALQEYI